MVKEGDKAPDFRLQADDGSEIALSDLRGKPVVLYFFPRRSPRVAPTKRRNFATLKPQFDEVEARDSGLQRRQRGDPGEIRRQVQAELSVC